MNISDELYREVILDHYKSPRNYGKKDHPDILEPGSNPLCGDEIELYLDVDDQKIEKILFHGKGCSISQAAASMMTEAVEGKNFSDVELIINDFKDMLLKSKDVETLRAELEDAKSLEGVKSYPVRIKCAVLPWATLQQALKKIKSKKS